MHANADDALAAVRNATGVSRVATIEVHQQISDSLIAALGLIPGQVKRFG